MLSRADEWVEQVRSRPPTDDLMPGVIPAEPGIILLSGRTGIGKTNLLLQLAHSAATGKQFLGFELKKSKVGFLAFEGTDDKMADRLDKMQRSFSPVGDNLLFARRSPRKLAGNEKEFFDSFKGVGLMIIDPLKYLVAGDYTKPHPAHEFLGALMSLIADLKAPIILGHHIRKPDKRGLIDPGEVYELKGAGDYVEAATSVLLLEREPQGHRPTGGYAPVNHDHQILYFAKARDAVEALDPIPLRFDREKLLYIRRDTEVYT